MIRLFLPTRHPSLRWQCLRAACMGGVVRCLSSVSVSSTCASYDPVFAPHAEVSYVASSVATGYAAAKCTPCKITGAGVVYVYKASVGTRCTVGYSG